MSLIIKVMPKSQLLAQDLLFGRRRSSFVKREVVERPPSLVTFDGSQQWLDDRSRLHRIGGPALVLANGGEEWRRKGKLHRIGGPALINRDGSEEWFFDGKRHRLSGPALTKADGSKHWFLHGLRHRDGGPAVEEERLIEYYQHGQLHRFGGPALICLTASGRREEEWHYGNLVGSKFLAS